MKRLSIKAFCLVLWIICGATTARAAIYRVGVIYLGGSEQSVLRGLRDGLLEAGFIEGDNLFLDMPYNGSLTELHSVAERFKDEQLDLIVSVGSVETTVAREVIKRTPIVFMPAENAQQSGFVETLARPNTNLSGISLSAGGEIEGKRLDLFKDFVQNLRHVTVFYDSRLADLNLAALHEVARRLGVVLTEVAIDSLAQAVSTVRPLSKNDTDGILVICSSLFNRLDEVGRLARQRKIPLFCCTTTQVAERHGLLAYSPDFYFMGYRGASYAVRILKGRGIGTLPVEAPMRYELVVNLKLARELGIDVPPEVLMRSDKVFN